MNSDNQICRWKIWDCIFNNYRYIIELENEESKFENIWNSKFKILEFSLINEKVYICNHINVLACLLSVNNIINLSGHKPAFTCAGKS